MAKPYKDEDYQYKPVDYYDSTDVGADELLLDPEGQAQVNAFKAQYDKAKEAGDQAGMEAAHAGAEGVRAGKGYQGGANGGAYNPLLRRQTAQAAPEAFTYEKAPEYMSKNQAIIDAALEQLRSRPAFSYDPETDPSYRQYREQYTRLGERAMEDTLGQMAARTGGLASSYAGSAAQQSYNQYMAALGDKIPELQRLAYEKYRAEGEDMRSDLAMLLNMEQMDRSAFESDRGQYNTDKSFKYGVWSDEQDRAYREKQDAAEMGYKLAERTHDWASEARQETREDRDRAVSEALNIYNATGDVTRLAESWELSPDEAKKMIDKYARQEQLTEQEAAIQIAKERGAIGDLAGYEGLGWDTSYAKQMQEYDRQQAAASLVKSQSGGGREGALAETEGTAYKDVVKKALSYDTPEEAKAYLERMVDDWGLDPEEAAYIYQVLIGGEAKELEEEQGPAGPWMSQTVAAGIQEGWNPAMFLYKKKY